MIVTELFDGRSRAADAVASLVEHLTGLLVCADLLDAAGHCVTAREVRGSLMRATTALQALRAELVTIEIVEHYLRTHERGGSPC